MLDRRLTALTNARIFTGEAFLDEHSLLIQDGKVFDLVKADKIPESATRISHSGALLAPGFIDCQVNGAGDVSVNANPTAATVLRMAEALRNKGTMRFLPTCITDNIAVMEKALAAVRTARQQDSGILGIHFEGPHIGLGKRGCHQVEHIRPITDAEMKLYRPEAGEIILITLAPETVSAEQIRQLKQQGVVISIGHSAATPEQVDAAVSAGASGFTHLFNAMSGLSAREPGVAGCALDKPNCFCGIIADGFHVHETMIRTAQRVKREKLFLVSDSWGPAASDDPQPFMLYGEEIRAQDGRCVNKTGQLVGSSVTLAESVKYLTKHVGIELGEALRMASAYPAAFLGLDKKYGFLLPGYKAEVSVLNI